MHTFLLMNGRHGVHVGVVLPHVSRLGENGRPQILWLSTHGVQNDGEIPVVGASALRTSIGDPDDRVGNNMVIPPV